MDNEQIALVGFDCVGVEVVRIAKIIPAELLYGGVCICRLPHALARNRANGRIGSILDLGLRQRRAARAIGTRRAFRAYWTRSTIGSRCTRRAVISIGTGRSRRSGRPCRPLGTRCAGGTLGTRRESVWGPCARHIAPYRLNLGRHGSIDLEISVSVRPAGRVGRAGRDQGAARRRLVGDLLPSRMNARLIPGRRVGQRDPDRARVLDDRVERVIPRGNPVLKDQVPAIDAARVEPEIAWCGNPDSSGLRGDRGRRGQGQDREDGGRKEISDGAHR